MERSQFATSSDGVWIAIPTLDAGPAVVMIPLWFSFISGETTGGDECC